MRAKVVFRTSNMKKKNSVLPFQGELNFFSYRKLTQPPRRQQQGHHKFAYLTMKNNSFARFARAFFILKHFADILDLSTTKITCFAVVWTRRAYDDKFCLLISEALVPI